MYAIVRTGGKQYRVERGQRLLVERLSAKEGSDVSLQPLLYRSEEAVFDRAGLERVKVTAKVLEHVRGERLRVVKFKPKRGYKRRTGHRQELTRIEVTDISANGARARQTSKVAETAPDGATSKAPKAAASKAPKAGSGKAPKASATKPVRAEAGESRGARAKAPDAKAPDAKPAGAKAPDDKGTEAKGADAKRTKPAKRAAPKAKGGSDGA